MANENLAGRTIAGSRLIERVGEGGTAEVYRAEHPEHGACAFKVLRQRLRGDPTHDPLFEIWANLVNNIQGDAAMSLKGFRKDIVINVMNLQGQVAISYRLYRAWVSEFQALPDLDAGVTNTVGIQHNKIEHEGWERDTARPEPKES